RGWLSFPPDRGGFGSYVRQGSAGKISGACGMKRRQFVGGAAGALFAGQSMGSSAGRSLSGSCGCALAPQSRLGADSFRSVGSRVKITGMKVFGVSLTPDSDRPFVFVKLETDAG